MKKYNIELRCPENDSYKLLNFASIPIYAINEHDAKYLSELLFPSLTEKSVYIDIKEGWPDNENYKKE